VQIGQLKRINYKRKKKTLTQGATIAFQKNKTVVSTVVSISQASQHVNIGDEQRGREQISRQTDKFVQAYLPTERKRRKF
jgi:hypothetical protein